MPPTHCLICSIFKFDIENFDNLYLHNAKYEQAYIKNMWLQYNKF
jgi:hypothetical protein